MLNLLPKDYSNKVRGEYLRRFYIVLLIGLSVFDVFLIVAMFPANTAVDSRKGIAEDADQTVKNSSKTKDENIILSNVKDLESRLGVIEMVPGDRPTDFIDKALELRGNGIYVRNISYIKKTDVQKEVVIEGVASTRSNLIDLSKRVKTSSWSTSSDIPLSNLASDKNIQFFVKLTATSTLR